MQGRFFAVPAFVSSFSIAIFLVKVHYPKISYALAITIILWGANSNSPLFVGSSYDYKGFLFGVADERGFYYQAYGLIAPQRQWPSIAELGKNPPTSTQVVCGGLGISALGARDQVHFIDMCALTDPLLSQLPAIEAPDWRIGHQARKIPVNYASAILDDTVALADVQLNELYKDIRTITHGELLSKDRLISIWRVNTHKYKIDQTIYKSSILVGDVIDWKGSQLHKILGIIKDTSIVVKQGNKTGVVTYGPYAILPIGKYKFDISYKSSEASTTSIGSWDFAIAFKDNVNRIKTGLLLGTNNQNTHIVDNFTISEELSKGTVEIRTFYEGRGELIIEGLSIQRVQ